MSNNVNYQGELAIRPTTGLDQWWGNRHFPFRHYAFTTRPALVAARDRQPAIASV
ncbi:hypothetical protein [Nocardia sp. NBC_00511]|uniref:hypothetical protein n=1 Tax=Nocardia sp. NBC_00511 TaxID=2903591 RepID=UPI0030E2BAB8